MFRCCLSLTIRHLLKQGWGSEACWTMLQQWPVVETAQPLCFQAESCWLGSRGSVAGFQQPIRDCGCVRPGRATSPGAGRRKRGVGWGCWCGRERENETYRERVCVCVWYDVPLGSSRIDEAADLCVLPMSSWRWRKQPWLPLSLSLFALITLSLALTLPALCIISYASLTIPSLHYLIPSFLVSPLSLQYLLPIFAFLPCFLFPSFLYLPPELSFSLSLSLFPSLSILSGADVLERCSATANWLLQGAKWGGGETCGRWKGLVVDTTPGALRDIGMLSFSQCLECFCQLFVWLALCELPIGFLEGYKLCSINGLEDYDSASWVLTVCPGWRKLKPAMSYLWEMVNEQSETPFSCYWWLKV